MKRIALIGNPNCGKSKLFNVLTGANQKVGNWPGVTVEKKFGYFKLETEAVELVDLPGIHSLEQDFKGIDEKIAQDFLEQHNIDVIINIVDGTNLERSLVLAQQLPEKTVPLVVVINMLDVTGKQGISINAPALAETLQVPVVPMITSRKQGVDELRDALGKLTASSARTAPDHRTIGSNRALPNEEKILRRYHRSRQPVNGVVEVVTFHHSLSERIDKFVLNKWLGVPCFLFMIYLMFTIAVNLGAVFIDFFAILLAAVLVDGLSWLLGQIGSPQFLTIFLAQGLGCGITLVSTFIPVIGFLYLCLSVLEDSGYM